MEQVYITMIKVNRDSLANLINGMQPTIPLEWDALEIVTHAHKLLRGINLDKLGQLPLPDFEEEERKRNLQPELPLGAAVQGGEDSLNDRTDSVLSKTADQQFEALRSAGDNPPDPPQPETNEAPAASRKRGRK